MYSGIRKIYGRKTKGTTLMELFIATGKLKTVF
jgi:Tfp pilus assembly protein PilW